LSLPGYRIGALAKLTGLSTHAIRVWERRYGAAAPSRSKGGARLYTEEDVRRFRLIKELLERGYSTRAIASLDVAQLSDLTRGDAITSPKVADTAQLQAAREAIDELLDAVAQLNLEKAERVLARAANKFSPRDLVTTVLAPALEKIGERWASGALCTASEHAASALFRTRLGALLSAQPVGKAPAVVCTTPSGEQHELGALLVAVLIAMRGRRAVFLGANLPAPQIVEAARMAKAHAVALSIIALPAEDARRELTRLAKLLPASVELVVGGRGLSDLSRLPTRLKVLASFAELERWLDTLAR
jgi:DNA-binding transcriptional MerR regulator/methylmalonyl-CoA mutase cobalamin-binding subunit